MRRALGRMRGLSRYETLGEGALATEDVPVLLLPLSSAGNWQPSPTATRLHELTVRTRRVRHIPARGNRRHRNGADHGPAAPRCACPPHPDHSPNVIEPQFRFTGLGGHRRSPGDPTVDAAAVFATRGRLGGRGLKRPYGRSPAPSIRSIPRIPSAGQPASSVPADATARGQSSAPTARHRQ